jgi:uncharacterized protein
MPLTTDRIIELLGLTKHPTCGYMGESFRSPLLVPASALPPEFGGGREFGGVLYFLVTPDSPVRLHRIRSDQVYHHYLGGPLEVLLLHPGGGHEVRAVGPDLESGMRPHLLVPGGAFHAARVPGQAGHALLATSVWARAEPQDVEMGDAERLFASHPEARELIRDFTR